MGSLLLSLLPLQGLLPTGEKRGLQGCKLLSIQALLGYGFPFSILKQINTKPPCSLACEEGSALSTHTGVATFGSRSRPEATWCPRQLWLGVHSLGLLALRARVNPARPVFRTKHCVLSPVGLQIFGGFPWHLAGLPHFTACVGARRDGHSQPSAVTHPRLVVAQHDMQSGHPTLPVSVLLSLLC